MAVAGLKKRMNLDVSGIHTHALVPTQQEHLHVLVVLFFPELGTIVVVRLRRGSNFVPFY